MYTVKKASLKIDKVGYVIIAPFCLFTFLFILVPLIANVFLSFTDYDLIKMNIAGFKNYLYLFQDEYFKVSLWNSLVYTFFTLIFTMALGLLTALLLRSNLAGITFFRTSFYTPYVTSMVAVSMIWLWMYDPSGGIVNQIIGFFGIPSKRWLYETDTAMGSIIFMSIWKAVGYNMVIYISGLHAIPVYLYEAGKIDGASVLRRFVHITYPMLKPVTFFLFITGFINNFKVFEQVQILTNGGPMNSTTTIVHQIYQRAFNEFALGYAAAESVVLLLIVAVITALNFKYGNQGNDFEIA